jgi:hypothetical protein
LGYKTSEIFAGPRQTQVRRKSFGPRNFPIVLLNRIGPALVRLRNQTFCPFDSRLSHVVERWRGKAWNLKENSRWRVGALCPDRRRHAAKDALRPPGVQLPTLEQLAEQLGVARVTVRQAMDLLEDEQLIWRRQGKGTFVTTHAEGRHWMSVATDWEEPVNTISGTESRVLVGKLEL